jgi:hypothetical protein
MYPDFNELLSIFNAHKVKYLIVGGYRPGKKGGGPKLTARLESRCRPRACSTWFANH